MSDYAYECHGDIFDAWDDHVAAMQGYTRLTAPLNASAFCDPVAERDRNIRAAHDFDAAVAAMEDSRYAAQMRRVG